MWVEMAFLGSVNKGDFGRDMQAAQNGRELETSASLPLKGMAGLTQLGAIMPCSAFTDVYHIGEV